MNVLYSILQMRKEMWLLKAEKKTLIAKFMMLLQLVLYIILIIIILLSFILVNLYYQLIQFLIDSMDVMRINMNYIIKYYDYIYCIFNEDINFL